jgi:hypothetical protein
MKRARVLHAICWAFSLIPFAVGSTGGAPAVPGSEACEYLNVYVDASIADESARGREIAEPMRRALLQLATDALPRQGLRVVRNPEDAYWTLTASSLVGPTSVGIFIEFSGSIELQHHLFIAELDRDGFRYRGEVGSHYYVDILPNTAPTYYRSEVDSIVRLLWGLESEQVAALCSMSAKLREEGWVDLRELRIELIEEMKRARRVRESATRTQHLELEVDAPRPSGDSE